MPYCRRAGQWLDQGSNPGDGKRRMESGKLGARLGQEPDLRVGWVWCRPRRAGSSWRPQQSLTPCPALPHPS